MAGQPQLREASWLYVRGDTIPQALIRVEQWMDGSGTWMVLHNVPASAPTRRSRHDSEPAARDEAQQLREQISAWCRQHGATGVWRTHTRDAY